MIKLGLLVIKFLFRNICNAFMERDKCQFPFYKEHDLTLVIQYCKNKVIKIKITKMIHISFIKYPHLHYNKYIK